MSNGQTVWLVICICFLFLWLTCGWLVFPFNLLGAFLTGIMMIPCFIRTRQ